MSLAFPLRNLLCATVLATASVLTSCLPVLEGEDYDLRGQQVRVSFLHTSDIHSRLIPYDYSPIKTDQDLGLIPDVGPFGGGARMSAIAKRERANSERLLHLDSGDSFQGAPIYNQNNGEVEFKFLSLLGLDAAVVGNHEFDSGAKNFAEQARDHATFGLLAANYIWEDAKQLDSNLSPLYTSAYQIRNLQGIKVGIVGMANVSSLNSLVEGGNSLQATPWEQNEALRAYVDLLRPMVDMIVVTSHLGLYEDQELINGYDAYYEYGRIKEFTTREHSQWTVLEAFPPVPEGEPIPDGHMVRVWIPGISGVDIVFGGHLHVVLSPPQVLQDPAGHRTLLVHSGAFAKFMGRLDVVVEMPVGTEDPERLARGAEVLSHDYKVFPLDGVWCNDSIRAFYQAGFWDPGTFRANDKVREAVVGCTAQEDLDAQELLQPYVMEMDVNLQLSSIFGYAPRDIGRRNNSTGGDSPLGNITADSMRKRRRVEAEVALTNTLGIRDNLYVGTLTQESMFNVFPFENTINIMYLSGVELQELFDFVADRSAERGCQSQAQISGARFTMDCAQAQLNALRLECTKEQEGRDCPQEDREGRAPWQCLEDLSGFRCYARTATDITIGERPLDPNATYKIAVNDYIAKGGSGFAVLKRNTTRIETGIPLRDSLIGYMQNFCSCDEYLTNRRSAEGQLVDADGKPCGLLINGTYVVEEQVINFCQQTRAFAEKTHEPVAGVDGCDCGDLLAGKPACGEITDAMRTQCVLPNSGPNLGRCTCADVVANKVELCGSITQETRAFCDNPTAMSVTLGSEDGRIGRRLK